MAISGTNFASLWNITDDVQGAASLEVVTDVVKSNGLNEGDLVQRLRTFITNHNAVNAKLDLDGGVADTNYAALTNITALASNPTEDPGVAEQGINDADLLALFRLIVTQVNTRNAKLDLDGTVAGTDYAALHNIAMPGSVQSMDTALGQQEITDFLELIITNHNALNAKFDAD